MKLEGSVKGVVDYLKKLYSISLCSEINKSKFWDWEKCCEKASASLFPKHSPELSEAVPSWMCWRLQGNLFHNSTLSHYYLISLLIFLDSFFQVLVLRQIWFTYSNAKIIIYEWIQKDSDEESPKYGSHDKGKREKAKPYSNGRGVLDVQEFNFSATENVFEALKYGYGDYTRVHLTFDLEGIKTARMYVDRLVHFSSFLSSIFLILHWFMDSRIFGCTYFLDFWDGCLPFMAIRRHNVIHYRNLLQFKEFPIHLALWNFHKLWFEGY